MLGITKSPTSSSIHPKCKNKILPVKNNQPTSEPMSQSASKPTIATNFYSLFYDTVQLFTTSQVEFYT